MTVQLDAIWTLVAALLAIQLGKRINAKIVWLERGNIPHAVTAGLFVSLGRPARPGFVLKEITSCNRTRRLEIRQQ